MSLIQGGPGFQILVDAVYHYLCTGETTGMTAAVEDLPLMLKEIVQQVNYSVISYLITVLDSGITSHYISQYIIHSLTASVKKTTMHLLEYLQVYMNTLVSLLFITVIPLTVKLLFFSYSYLFVCFFILVHTASKNLSHV